MNITSGLISPLWLLVSNGLFFVACLWALTQVPWRTLVREKALQHSFFGALALLSLFWCLRAGVSDGLSVHFLGIATLTLVFGLDLTLIGGALVLLAMVPFGLESLEAWGLNGVCMVLAPALFIHTWWRWVEGRFGKNFFIYLFGCGFLGAALSTGLAGSLVSAVLWLDGVYSWDTLMHNYLRYLPLILFPEALLNGIILTGVLVFHPDWVRTFDAYEYIDRQ